MTDMGEWATGDDPSEEEIPARRYETLDQFVNEFLVSALWVDLSGQDRIWCPEWWRHTAAVMRLDALHRAFESMRLDPGAGLSVWILHHADPQMTVLTSPQGPLKGCSVDRGHDADRDRVIPVIPAPAGLFGIDD